MFDLPFSSLQKPAIPNVCEIGLSSVQMFLKLPYTKRLIRMWLLLTSVYAFKDATVPLDHTYLA